MMAMARTGNPEAAAEEERSATRERMRVQRAHVRLLDQDGESLLDRICWLFLQLYKSEKAEFLAISLQPS